MKGQEAQDLTAVPPTRPRAPHVPKPGVYVPAITFFNPSADILEPHLQSIYYTYLSTTGLTGLVILGTNAETLLLSPRERRILIETARQAVGPSYPLIVGCSGHSTSQVLGYLADAAEAGADYALVLPCAYFGPATTTSVIKSFFSDIAKASPLPILIYNFPAVCNGVDLDSDIITELARENGNIVGVKLTCASLGKLTRLCATFKKEEFAVFGGQSDFLIPGLSVGSSGCIAAFGNVVPKVLVKVYDLWIRGERDEAVKLQGKEALAERSVKSGIAAVKFACGLGAGTMALKDNGIWSEELDKRLRPRKPYEPIGKEKGKWIGETLKEILEIEMTL